MSHHFSLEPQHHLRIAYTVALSSSGSPSSPADISVLELTERRRRTPRDVELFEPTLVRHTHLCLNQEALVVGTIFWTSGSRACNAMSRHSTTPPIAATVVEKFAPTSAHHTNFSGRNGQHETNFRKVRIAQCIKQLSVEMASSGFA